MNIKYKCDPASPKLHPCGYWEYLKKEIYKEKPGNTAKRFENPSNYNKVFKWTDYLKEMNRAPVPASLFNEEQHEGMCSSKEFLNTYFPSFNKDGIATLSCKFQHNPRSVWHSLNKLSQEDMTEIYSKLCCFKILNEETQNKDILNTIPALVLLPKDSSEMATANLEADLKLEVSCLHRESVKLESASDTTSYIITSLPHLLQSNQVFELTENMRLDDISYLYMSLITSLDLTRQHSDWFKNISKILSLVSPLSLNIRFRSTKTPMKEILIDEFLAYYAKKNANKSEIDKIIDSKIAEYSINNAGACKYCTALDMVFAPNQPEPNVYLSETLKKQCTLQ